MVKFPVLYYRDVNKVSFFSLTSFSLSIAPPTSPRLKPHLFAPSVSTEAGVYTIDIGNEAANNMSSADGDFPLTSFIVRVLHEATNRIAFYWMVSK